MTATRRARRTPTANGDRAQRAAEIHERLRRELADAVAQLRSEDRFRAWLRACARLHRYSLVISGGLCRRRLLSGAGCR
jgi:hypothetical protein